MTATSDRDSIGLIERRFIFEGLLDPDRQFASCLNRVANSPYQA
jgi:hypothetical protein